MTRNIFKNKPCVPGAVLWRKRITIMMINEDAKKFVSHLLISQSPVFNITTD